jgi:competence protein ComEA
MEPPAEGWSRYKWPVLICLLGTVLVLGGLFLSKPTSSSATTSASLTKPADALNKTIKVDVSGAVIHPDVYEFPVGSRIEDAIAAAGGFTTTVSTSFVSQKLNLSAKLTDGQKIYIPFNSDAQIYILNQNSGPDVAGATTLIAINSATLPQLDQLPGVGPVTAQKIIDNRPFQSLEELVSRKVLSGAVFEKIKDKISLD